MKLVSQRNSKFKKFHETDHVTPCNAYWSHGLKPGRPEHPGTPEHSGTPWNTGTGENRTKFDGVVLLSYYRPCKKWNIRVICSAMHSNIYYVLANLVPRSHSVTGNVPVTEWDLGTRLCTGLFQVIDLFRSVFVYPLQTAQYYLEKKLFIHIYATVWKVLKIIIT